MKKYFAKVISDDFTWRNAGDNDVYLASEVDARIAELERDLKTAREAQRCECATDEICRFGKRIAELESHNQEHQSLAGLHQIRIEQLEKALRYWIADESLVTPEHQAAWDEHVKLLSGSL